MERMDGKSLDIVKDNIDKLKDIFPEVFCEDKVDFDRLKEVLGEYIEDIEERYSFTWNGKSRAIRLAQTSSMGTLRPVKGDSKNWDTTQNLYIEGDNLEALKLLQKSYYKKVKMIYIDPPYNTGKDFVYPDNYRDNLQNYLELTGQVDEEGKKLGTNSDTSGRYHSDWLNMMYPRLKLARNLLKQDGVIFVSIDENEQANLKKVMDEIFGEENHIDTIVWKKRYGGGAKEKYLVTVHENILFYAKDINELPEIFVPLSEESIKRYYKSRDDNFNVRGPYRTHPLEATKSVGERKNLVFPIVGPDGVEIWPKKQWWWDKGRVTTALDKGELEFVKSKTGEYTVHTKQYLKDEHGNIRKTKAQSIIDDIFTQHGTKEIEQLFSKSTIFTFPKPSDVMKKLIDIAGVKKEQIVLDFFSGAASTAHSVIKSNVETEGNIKFIMVQLPEKIDENLDAYKAGYKNICEIGKDRIRRAGEKIIEENKEKDGIENLDVGFKVFRLDTSNIKTWNANFDNIIEQLEHSVNNIKEDRSQEDVLYEILLKYGLDLTLPVEEMKLADKTVYSFGCGALVICLDDDIALEVVEEIGKLKEDCDTEIMRVVFKDTGFKNDSVKTNAMQILKRYSIEDIKSI